MKYTVRLQHGTYTQTVTVFASDDEDAVAKARSRARRDGFYCLPMAYESERIVERTEDK